MVLTCDALFHSFIIVMLANTDHQLRERMDGEGVWSEPGAEKGFEVVTGVREYRERGRTR